MNIEISPPSGLNEPGDRKHNEDAIFPFPGTSNSNDRLFLICDGVGGANKGEIASRLVVEGISHFFTQNPSTGPIDEDYLYLALRQTELEMSAYLLQHPECKNMATTLALLYLDEAGVIVAWAGDSRIYQFRRGKCIFKSKDHSLVAELVKQGKITEEEAENHPRKNIILRAVKGSGEDATEIDIRRLTDIQPEDIFFLCSDGINEQWNESRLGDLFSEAIIPEQMTERIKARSEGNTRDNFSSYLIAIKSITPLTQKVKTPFKKSSYFMITGSIVVIFLILVAGYFVFFRSPKTELSAVLLAKTDSALNLENYENAIFFYDSLRRLTSPLEEVFQQKIIDKMDSLNNIISIEKTEVRNLSRKADTTLSTNDYLDLLNTEIAFTAFSEIHRKNNHIEKKLIEIRKAISAKEKILNSKEQVNLILKEWEYEVRKGKCDKAKNYLSLAISKAGTDKEALKSIDDSKSQIKLCD